MREYNIISIKDFKRAFNSSLLWTVLSVTDEEGYSRKIAIKKDLLKKTFKVNVSGIGTSGERKLKDVDLNQQLAVPYKGGKSTITIPNLGVFTVNNYHLSLANPQQEILSTNNQIEEAIIKATNKANDIAEAEMSNRLKMKEYKYTKQLEQLEKKYKDEKIDRECSITNQLYSIQDYLMEGTYKESGTENYFEKPNELQKSMGYTCVPRTRDVYSEGKITCDLKFLLEELVTYAQNKGYTGFDGNRFQTTQATIKSLTSQISEEYSDKKVKDVYVLHGLLASELCTRFIGFCKYIEENNIDTRYTWSRTVNRREWDDEYTLTNTVTDFFQKTIDGIAKYTKRVFGDEYSNQFIEQVGSLKHGQVTEKTKEKKI
ncbi:MAG: hypothetical protein J6B89_04615 [Bacilli bacterium]|nr:hypothetical protein [Bacilli bacterium]